MGIILGLILLGPAGIIIGLLFGHLLDRYFWQISQKTHWAAQEVFFNTAFKVMGYLAKADGRVSEQEIKAARSVMRRMGLNEQQRLRAIELFNLGKNGQLDLAQELQHLRQVSHSQQSLLRIFLEVQLQAAFADGFLSAAKQEILQQICRHLGLMPFNFAGFSGYQQQSHQHSRQHTRPAHISLEQDYALLNVAKTASDAEVKKAYRKMMSQNHPDKLVAKGLPDSMIKLATEKTQQIQAAYERICRSRGM